MDYYGQFRINLKYTHRFASLSFLPPLDMMYVDNVPNPPDIPAVFNEIDMIDVTDVVDVRNALDMSDIFDVSNTLDDIHSMELKSPTSTNSYAFPMLSKGSILPPQSLVGLSYSSDIPSIQPSWSNQPSAGLPLSSPTANASTTVPRRRSSVQHYQNTFNKNRCWRILWLKRECLKYSGGKWTYICALISSDSKVTMLPMTI
jgi:hypothetical protein